MFSTQQVEYCVLLAAQVTNVLEEHLRLQSLLT